MKKKIYWVLRAVVSIGILVYIFSIIPYEEVLQNLKKANISYVIFGAFMLQLLNYFAAKKYRILTDKQKMTFSTWEIVKINYYTKFYDLFLPQVISEGVIRWYIISKNDKMPAQALAVMVFNRYTDFQILSVLGFVFWVLDKPPNSSTFMGIGLAALIFILGILHFIIFNRKISSLIIELMNKIKFLPVKITEKINKVLNSILEYRNLTYSDFVGVFVFNLAKHITAITAHYLFALSMDLNVSFLTIGWIRTIILILCTLPISIGGFGVREGSLIYMLGIYNISAATAVAFSFLLYLGNLFGSLIGGIFIIQKLLSSKRKKIMGNITDGTAPNS